MDDDSQAIATGLGAGLGGFAGFIIIACILWHCICGCCCEKKKVQSTRKLAPIKDQRKTKIQSSHKSHVTTVTFMNTKTVSLNLQSH